MGVADGRVFVTKALFSGQPQTIETFAAAVAADTGEQLWSFAMPSGSVSPPAVADDRVFFAQDASTSGGDSLFALDAGSGAVHWQKPVNTSDAPTVFANRIWLAGFGASSYVLQGFDVEDGARQFLVRLDVSTAR